VPVNIFHYLALVCAVLVPVFGLLATRRQAAASTTASQRASAEQKARHEELMAQAERNTAKMIAALSAKNVSMQDQLRARYPSGYVLLGVRQEDEVVVLPVYRGDLKVEADWAKTQIKLDREHRRAKLKIPTPKWTMESGPHVSITISDSANWEGPYEVGKSIRIPLVHVGGQPDMYFEVLDENPAIPIYVIGFKK
jgi:hypothetical protein